MSKPKPACEAAARWLREASGDKRIFAGFTGQDFPAWEAFVHGLELYTRCDHTGQPYAIACMRGAVMAMQPKLRWVARETIPWASDWGMRETLWPLIVGLDGSLLPDGVAHSVRRLIVAQQAPVGGAA